LTAGKIIQGKERKSIYKFNSSDQQIY